MLRRDKLGRGLFPFGVKRPKHPATMAPFRLTKSRIIGPALRAL